MSQPEELTIVEVDGHKIGVLKMPPPHLMLLASKMSSEPAVDQLKEMTRQCGLVAMAVRTIDGEEVVNKRKLPRDIPELEDLGEAYVMAAWDVFGSYESLRNVSAAVFRAYHGEVPNPT